MNHKKIKGVRNIKVLWQGSYCWYMVPTERLHALCTGDSKLGSAEDSQKYLHWFFYDISANKTKLFVILSIDPSNKITGDAFFSTGIWLWNFYNN